MCTDSVVVRECSLDDELQMAGIVVTDNLCEHGVKTPVQ